MICFDDFYHMVLLVYKVRWDPLKEVVHWVRVFSYIYKTLEDYLFFCSLHMGGEVRMEWVIPTSWPFCVTVNSYLLRVN